MEETLGKRIVSHRKRLKLTQDQLAEKMGVTAQAISKWENDQSCPDIALLPRLAALFGISTDELLGCRTADPIHHGEVVEDEPDGIHLQKGNWEFHWDNGKRDSVGFAIWVLAVGILYLLSHIFDWSLSFWDTLWPTALIIFGILRLFERLSFLGFGCFLFGGYALVSKIGIFSLNLEKNVIWAVLIVLFGGSLLVEAIRKPRKKNLKFRTKNSKTKSDYQADNHSFTYHARFGETTIPVLVPSLKSGDIQVSFGEYTVDLTQAEAILPNCHINAACSFGSLRLLLPRSCKLVPVSSTSFAEFTAKGVPDENAACALFLDAHVSFGEITAEYV